MNEDTWEIVGAPMLLDNDGDALIVGALYFSTATTAMYAWSGSAWGATFPATSSIVDNGNATAITIGTDESTTFASTIINKQGTDVASAGALALGIGNYFDITGTTTITSINTKGIGTCIVLQFDAILTLTHHATDLKLPSAANITTAAGDIAVLHEYAIGDWRCVSYTRTSGLPVVVVAQNTASDGASMVLLSTQTASASATVDFTTNIDSTYDNYVVKISGMVPASTGFELNMRVSVAATFKSDALYYWGLGEVHQGGVNLATGGTTDTSIRLATSLTNTAANPLNYNIYFSNPDSTALYPTFYGDGVGFQTTNGVSGYTSAGYYLNTAAIDGIRLLMSSGNITSGTFRLFGIKDA